MGKVSVLSDNYHDIRLLTIIVSSKYWTILIIVKENITNNRQNRLIAHPYIEHKCAIVCQDSKGNSNILGILRLKQMIVRLCLQYLIVLKEVVLTYHKAI